jgi:hypothetical protein
MIPAIPKDFHGSKGEERVFRALRSLPDEIIVIHSFRWLHPGKRFAMSRQLGAQGEGDFVLVDPGRGVLVVEVKGGEVWCEEGDWYQRNRLTGQVLPIDPEAQASNTMFRIRSEVVKRMPEAASVLFCHAVWFPDGAVDRTALPFSCHADMTLDSEDIAQPEGALRKVFDYWRSLHPHRRGTGSQTGAILNLLAPSFSVVRSVRQTLDERQDVLIQLTREQAKVLDFLDEQFHAAIHGAAGTGKTLLAVEKARRVATPGAPALFLCFNSCLRDHLREHHSHPNVSFHTIHGLAREIVGNAGSLDDAVEALLIHLADDKPLPYAHVIVDEGQDFAPDWLEYLRLRFRDGTFYVFYDRHQAVQGLKDTSWIDEIPCRLVLTRNCRNTDPIAKVAYRAAGLQLTPTLGLEGPQPWLHTVDDDDAVVTLAEELIAAACNQHKTAPHEIAVLSLDTIAEQSRWRRATLGGQPVADSVKAKCVTVTTARRFKGLEASLVIVVDADFARANDAVWRLLLYVACSRARHAVHIITNTPEAAIVDGVRALAASDKAQPNWRTLCRCLGVRRGGTKHDPFE